VGGSSPRGAGPGQVLDIEKGGVAHVLRIPVCGPHRGWPKGNRDDEGTAGRAYRQSPTRSYTQQ
jgi:hypothetical protein